MTSQVLSPQASPPLEAWIGLLRSHALVTKELSAQLQADHGLTINDYEALLRLSRAEGQAMRRVDLAGELLLTPSGITRLLDGLERAGYVQNRACDSDARVKYAALTTAGRDKLEHASRSHVLQIRGFFQERFSADELRSLAELLGRLGGPADPAECEASGGAGA